MYMYICMYIGAPLDCPRPPPSAAFNIIIYIYNPITLYCIVLYTFI